MNLAETPSRRLNVVCFAFSLLLIHSSWGQDAILEISEFVASNSDGMQDESGAFSDWIEIHNRTDDTVSLAGIGLTDQADEVGWVFPEGASIAPNGYIIVFASGREEVSEGEWHCDFKLSADGEYLGLIASDGETAISEFDPYPPQYTNISYGLSPDGTEKM